MKYCKKIDRECKYFDICNDSNQNIDIDNSKYKDIFLEKNIEEILFNLGLKKVWKLEDLSIDELDKEIEKNKLKYIYGAYTFNDENNIRGDKLKGKKYVLLFSNNNNYIIKFIYFEHSPKQVDRIVATGLLLGYPKCCSVEHYNSTSSQSDSYKMDKEFSEGTFFKDFKCKLLNPYLKLYRHTPCSQTCKKTIEDSEKVLQFLEGKYGLDIVKYFFSVFNNNIDNIK